MQITVRILVNFSLNIIFNHKLSAKFSFHSWHIFSSKAFGIWNAQSKANNLDHAG
jgi:hypothetical protein